MKRQLLAFLLAAVLLVAQNPASAAAAPTAQQQAAGAYLGIVNDMIGKYGICTNDFSDDCKGLAYADLIDFDKDGISELFAVYKPDTERHYMLGIWAYANKKVSRVLTKDQGAYSRTEGISHYLASTKTNTYLVESFDYSTGLAEPPYSTAEYDIDTYFTVSGNKLVKSGYADRTVDYHDVTEKERKRYVIGLDKYQRTATEKDYKEYLAKFGAQPYIPLVVNSAGYVSFGFDTGGNASTMSAFKEKLVKIMRGSAYKNMYGTLKPADKDALSRFLYHFSHLGAYNASTAQGQQLIDFVQDGIHHGDFGFAPDKPVKNEALEPDVDENYFHYYPYSAEKLDAFTKRLFGKTIPRKNYEYAYLKANNFYILSPEMGSDPSTYSSQVHTMYALGKGLYYVEFTKYDFDRDTMDQAGFRDDTVIRAIDSWSASEKKAAADSLQYSTQGFAVLKEVAAAGAKSWQLVRYSTSGSVLSNEQLAAYRK